MLKQLVRLLVAFRISPTVFAAPGFVLRSIGVNPLNTSSSTNPLNSATLGDCGKCGIEAPGGVQLVYFQPDSTLETLNTSAAPSLVYTTVSDGFTFTSPSVYVIYSSLRATATCGQSSLGTIGPSFDKKTIGYSSKFLAYGTVSSPDQRCDENVVVDGFHTIDFTSLYYHPITTTATSKAGCPPYVNPRLSLPAELTNVDPSWKSCEPLFYGAFDPPRVLQKAGALVPPPIDASPITSEGPKPSIVPSPSPSPVPTARVGPSVSSQAPQNTATESASSTVQTPAKGASKPQEFVPPNTSSFAAAGPSSSIAVNNHPVGGHSLSDTSDPLKSQQQNNDPSEPNFQASGNSPSSSYLPTIGGGNAQKQSEGNPVQGERSTLNGQAGAVASHGTTQVPSHVNGEATQSSDPENKSKVGQIQSGSSSAGHADAVTNQGATQIPSHVNEEETLSPNPESKAGLVQIQSASSSAMLTPNREGSSSNDATEQPYPATGPQPTAPEAHGRLPSIIFLHDYHQEPSKGESTDLAPSAASPTSLASDPNQDNFAQIQNHDSVAQYLPGGGLEIGSQTLALGQQAEIQEVTVSVGRSVIALDGATYTRAAIGGSTALSGTTVAGLDDEEPFTLLLPTQGLNGIASVTATVPGASVSALPDQQSAIVSGSQGSPTYQDASAQDPNDTDGDAGIGAAILQAFNPTGSFPVQVTSASVAQIGTTSRESSSAASNSLTGVASAQVALTSVAQIGTASRGSVSAASNALTGVASPSLPAPSPFDSAATMLTVVRCLKWLSIGLAVYNMGI